jgi:hypothetical protein
MKTRRAVLCAGMMMVVVLFVGGCVAVAIGGAAAGAGAVAYVQGSLEVTVTQKLDHVYKATKTTLDQMGVIMIESKLDALGGSFVFRDAADDKITVKMKRTPEDITSMSIRVGLFGDEAKSRSIYAKITKNY